MSVIIIARVVIKQNIGTFLPIYYLYCIKINHINNRLFKSIVTIIDNILKLPKNDYLNVRIITWKTTGSL